VYVGIVWPGESVFPDFTLTRVREWWGGLYKDFVGMGAAGFWNDMDEPALFQRADKTMPLDTVHRLDDGTTLDHRAIHNIFGLENVRATYDGLRKLGIPFYPSQANFVLAQIGSAHAAFVAGMKQHGILVRDRSSDPGCDGWVRITLGSEAHTEQLLAALRQVLADLKIAEVVA
jgi:hypothetical protein